MVGKSNSTVKIVLRSDIKDKIDKKARLMGMGLSTYLRHLILKELVENDLPVYKASNYLNTVVKDSFRQKRYKTKEGKASELLTKLTK